MADTVRIVGRCGRHLRDRRTVPKDPILDAVHLGWKRAFARERLFTWTFSQTTERADLSSGLGGGLIGLLVVVAAIALAFTARYPPFRLDTGGDDPPATLTPPPTSPGEHVTHSPQPIDA